jgi:hypothetical protein
MTSAVMRHGTRRLCIEKDGGEIGRSRTLRVRTRIILKGLGVTTIDELAALTAAQIQGAPNAGVETLPDVETFLAKHNKHLSS